MAEELHAIFRQPLLDLGNVRTVARFYGAEHVNARQIRAGEGPVLDDGVALGLLTVPMFVVGTMFLGLWVLGFVLGTRLDDRPETPATA